MINKTFAELGRSEVLFLYNFRFSCSNQRVFVRNLDHMIVESVTVGFSMRCHFGGSSIVLFLWF